MIINNGVSIEQRRRATNSKPLSNTNKVTVSIQAEFLDSCEFNCAGCFVKRKNNFTDQELLDLKAFILKFDDKYELNELVLSPTDMFGANNTAKIISNPLFISLFQQFNALTFNSTLLSDPKYVDEVMSFIRSNYPKHIYYEMFVVLDIEKFIAKDSEYITRLEENLSQLTDVNIIFVYNIHSSIMFDNIDIGKVSKEINDRYNSHFRMNPSFFRTHKHSLIIEALDKWRDRLGTIYNDSNIKNMLFNMIDPHFGADTYITLTFKDGKIYRNPYIYDYIFDNSESVAQEVRYATIERISKQSQDNQIQQYKYASNIECDVCPLLSSCVNRNVIKYMENNNISKCFLPKDLMLKANKL